MKFSEQMKTTVYWKKALQIALLFLIILTVISLLFNSFSAVIRFDFDQVMEENFANGLWKRFFVVKIFLSISYGMYMAYVNMKKGRAVR